MFKYTTISSDSGYEIVALMPENDLRTYSAVSFENKEKDIYWDNDDYLYNEFYNDLKKVIKLKEQFQSSIGQFFAKYDKIEVDRKSEVNIDLIDELYEIFQEAESMGFFNEVIEEKLKENYDKSKEKIDE